MTIFLLSLFPSLFLSLSSFSSPPLPCPLFFSLPFPFSLFLSLSFPLSLSIINGHCLISRAHWVRSAGGGRVRVSRRSVVVQSGYPRLTVSRLRSSVVGQDLLGLLQSSVITLGEVGSNQMRMGVGRSRPLLTS